MEFCRTYPYLVANALSVAGILAVLLFIPRGPYRRSVLWSGLICLPAALLALLSEGSYWSPVRWGGGHWGIEDLLFTFACGSSSWLLAAWPFRRRLGMEMGILPFVRRYLLVVASFAAASVLLWQAGVRGMMNSLLGGMAPLLLALGLRRDLGRFAAAGLLLFVPAYALVVKGQFLLWPDYVRQWNQAGPGADLIWGIPVGEWKWAVSFAVQWPVIIGYLLGVRIHPTPRPDTRASSTGPTRPSRAGLFIFIALATAACLSCLPYLLVPSCRPWPHANVHLQIMVFLTAAAFFHHACLTASFRDAIRLLTASVLVGGALEYSGIRWAFACGSRYHYEPSAIPQFPAGVPVCVLLMWFILAYTAVALLRPLAIRTGGALSWTRLAAKASLCALYLVAMDLFLDPLCTTIGLWTWENPGPYFTVPIRNFISWFFTGLIMCGVYLALERPRGNRPAADDARLDSSFLLVSLTLTAFCFCAGLMLVPSTLPVALSLACISPYWIWRLAPRRRSAYHRDPDSVVRGETAGGGARAGRKDPHDARTPG